MQSRTKRQKRHYKQIAKKILINFKAAIEVYYIQENKIRMVVDFSSEKMQTDGYWVKILRQINGVWGAEGGKFYTQQKYLSKKNDHEIKPFSDIQRLKESSRPTLLDMPSKSFGLRENNIRWK